MGQCNKMLEEMSFNALFQKLPVGIEVYDERGQLVDLNRTDENLFAISRKDIMGINLFENPNFPEDKIARLKQGEMVVFDCNYEFDNIQTNEYYNIDPKKEGINLRLSIKCVPLKGEAEDICGYVLMFTDETEEYQKSEKVEELFTKLKTVMRCSDSLLWEYDVKTDKMHIDLDLRVLGNKSRLRASNLTTKKDFCEIVYPEDRERVLVQGFEKIVMGEIGEYSIQYRQLFEGQYVWVRAYAYPYKYDEAGRPAKILYYLMDITDEIAMQDKLRWAEREFYVDIIDKNSELLLQLIEDILDFSKIEAGTFDITKRNFDFKEICEETYAVHALKIPKNVRFVFDRGSQPVTVFSDPKRVVQVISNFLTNAIKFTSEGEIKLAYKVSKDEIRVSVSDTGMGISEEDCRTIFDRFVKLNACKQGTGLGLAICKNIIEKLGGRIGVESTLGVGSTFWFTLPLKEIKENEPKF